MREFYASDDINAKAVNDFFFDSLKKDNHIHAISIYKNGEKIYGLKPYIHYSCRYQNGNTDVVITYSLDNYISVEGIVKGKSVYMSGYLLDNVSNNGTTYRGVNINTENLTENVTYFQDSSVVSDTYTYNKVYGTKNYKNGDNWFSIFGGQVYPGTQSDEQSNAGVEYYRNAYEFTNWVRSNLGDITTSHAKDDKGNSLADVFGTNIEIFGKEQGNAESIEDPNSNFNQHRLAVIRYSIEKNLSIAIANYNRYTPGITTNFQMPELKEDEWEKILNNVSIISFMQGLSIGGKIYNGYSIVTNTKTEEVVNLDSIYIITSDGYYHRATESDLVGRTDIQMGVFNIDFERKGAMNTETRQTHYYYPRRELGCYNCYVSQTTVQGTDNIYEYMDGKGQLAKIYYTALGRERYSMYKVFRNQDEHKRLFM